MSAAAEPPPDAAPRPESGPGSGPGRDSGPVPRPGPDPTVAPFAPQGRAVAEAWRRRRVGDPTPVEPLEVHDGSDAPELVDVDLFLRDAADFEDWERALLDACRGRVLDVGAGAGSHARHLAARGHAVTALDVDPDCVAVMLARGVRDARLGTLGDVDDGPFDTVLFAMHGIGLAGDLAGLHWVLAEAWRLLSPDGVVLLDSRSPTPELDQEPATALHPASAEPDAPYPGECELWMRHGPLTGARFGWLFVDAARLAAVAGTLGLATEVLRRFDDAPGQPGRYLARLARHSGC